jgi:hypothetical protein
VAPQALAEDDAMRESRLVDDVARVMRAGMSRVIIADGLSTSELIAKLEEADVFVARAIIEVFRNEVDFVLLDLAKSPGPAPAGKTWWPAASKPMTTREIVSQLRDMYRNPPAMGWRHKIADRLEVLDLSTAEARDLLNDMNKAHVREDFRLRLSEIIGQMMEATKE